MTFRITRTTSSAGPDPDDNDLADIQDCTDQLDRVERHVLGGILFRMNQEFDAGKNVRSRAISDGLFANFSHFILRPYADAGMASRAARFSASLLIPAVMDFEAKKGCEVHKGALFYDTALAFLVSGDEARFEYYLAMTDEEDFRTHAVEGKPQERGMHNKKLGGLSSQTIQVAVDFAVRFANGPALASACPASSVLGGPLTEAGINVWRANLDVYHHAELFRSLTELRIFCGEDVPTYSWVRDNPYVMLRLVKVLAHIAQWGESQLTLHQKGVIGDKTLHPKLAKDPDLSYLVGIAGKDTAGKDRFPGLSVNGPDVDKDLRNLLAEIRLQTTADERAWRVLRILYIVRNSTAHQIETTLDFYKDRGYLVDLLQATLVAVLLIQQKKGIKVV